MKMRGEVKGEKQHEIVRNVRGGQSKSGVGGRYGFLGGEWGMSEETG